MASSSSVSALAGGNPNASHSARVNAISGNWIDEALSFSSNLMTLGRDTGNKRAALNQLNADDAAGAFRFTAESLLSAERRGETRFTYLKQASDVLAQVDSVLPDFVHSGQSKQNFFRADSTLSKIGNKESEGTGRNFLAH